MTTALLEEPAVIGEADMSRPGAKSLGEHYIYLRFKHSDGQDTTDVRVKVAKHARSDLATATGLARD